VLAADLIRARTARLTSLLGIEHAILGGPMAGVNTPELVAAVSNAGGLGSIGCGMMTAEQIVAAVGRIRELTDRSFAINLFITPQPAVDEAQILRMQAKLAPIAPSSACRGASCLARSRRISREQFDAVLAARVPVFSFTFGALDAPRRQALRAQGARVIGTASCVREGRQLAELGCDAIVVSGSEAGGHRPTFAVPPQAAQVGLFACCRRWRRRWNCR